MHCHTVFNTDAVKWLKEEAIPADSSLFASLPDISEFPQYTLMEWSNWFKQTAKLIMDKTPHDQLCFFFQSDIKLNGVWIDKGFLIQLAASEANLNLIWHKIVLRAPLGTTTFGRPSYSHLFCFSKNLKRDPAHSSPDVFYEDGEKTWARGIGEKTARFIVDEIKKHSTSKTLINPFCGEGLILKIASENQLHTIGIELSPKRAKKTADWLT